MTRPSPSADVILDFSSWLRKKRASAANALWFRHSNLFKATIWEMGDCGGYQMVCDSLFETTRREKVVVPASKADRVVYYGEESLPLARPTELKTITARSPKSQDTRVFPVRHPKARTPVYSLYGTNPEFNGIAPAAQPGI